MSTSLNQLAERKKQRLLDNFAGLRLAFKLGILSASNIGIAFLFQWYVFVQLGPGVKTDALFAGMTIPQLVLAVISGSLMHVLVPLLSGENEEDIRHDAWGFLVLIGGMFTFLAIVFYVTAQWWVLLIVPGFNESGQALTIMLTRIQLVGMVFAAVNGVQWAVYHARQQFLWAEFTPLLVSVFILLLLVLTLPRYGVIAAAWLSALRMGLQTMLLAPGMGRPVRPNLKSPAFRQAWKRINPLLLGTTYYKTDTVVDRFLLSTTTSGSLSLYYLAQQMLGAINQIINKAIVTPLVPALSMLHKTDDKANFRRVYYRKLLQVGMLSIVGLLVLGLWGQNLLSLLIGHGHVSASNVKDLWWITIWLGGMFVGGMMGQIAASSFYSMGDTVTPTRMSVFTYTFYMPSKILSFYFWGVAGLSIATSIYYLINLFFLIYLFRRNMIL